jgi:hypothetical protein
VTQNTRGGRRASHRPPGACRKAWI